MATYNRLDERMKEYEKAAQHYLTKRTPVIIRVDGKAAHTYTKNVLKPYDNIFHQAMDNAMILVAKEIQGCYFAYNESDECSFVLQDYETLTTDAWFSYRTDKLCSIAASLMTLYFNKEFQKIIDNYIWDYHHSLVPQSMEIQIAENKYQDVLKECNNKGLVFDARCFNIPKDEIVNYFFYRQLDAVRNSIQSCGQYYFFHKELHKKNTKDILEMLKQKGVSWETSPICVQRGTACYKTEEGWVLDKNMPMLKGDGRKYLEDLIPKVD